MDKLSNLFRQGARQDGEWLFQLFRRTMRSYIDMTWGWDELLQKQGFYEHLGFEAVGEDEHSLQYIWSDAAINEMPGPS